MCSFAWFLSFIMSVEVATLLYASDSLLFHSKYLCLPFLLFMDIYIAPHLDPAMVSATQSICVWLLMDSLMDTYATFSWVFP